MSSYIMDLRKIVGHRPLLQVGASVIVEDKEGRILLQLRSDNHCWGYAGGSVELDEDVEEAAKRELFEETGLVAKELTLFGVFSGKDTHYVYPNGDEVSNVDIVYICKDYSGDLLCQEGEVDAPLVAAKRRLSPFTTEASTSSYSSQVSVSTCMR